MDGENRSVATIFNLISSQCGSYFNELAFIWSDAQAFDRLRAERRSVEENRGRYDAA